MLPIDARLRWSLLSRMLVSLAAIAAVSLTVALVAAAVIGVVVLLGVAAAALGLWLVLSAFGAAPSLGGLSTPLSWEVVALVMLIGLLALPLVYLRPVRDEIRSFERRLGARGRPATERHPEIASTARRLAQQADVPEPTVRIANRARPESYALGGRSAGTIIVTRGLVRALDEAEREAVLAHEVSHLANGDGRLVRGLLVPMLVAEDVGGSERPELTRLHGLTPITHGAHLLGWALVRVVTAIQLRLCLVGVALLSRGRELAADRGAARLTGSPAALASALETLQDDRGRPTEDLRDVRRSAGALDILPPAGQGAVGWPFRTHPRTETRIEHLRSVADARSTVENA